MITRLILLRIFLSPVNGYANVTFLNSILPLIEVVALNEPSLIDGSQASTSLIRLPEAIPLDAVWNILVIRITALSDCVTYVIAAMTLPGVTEPLAT